MQIFLYGLKINYILIINISKFHEKTKTNKHYHIYPPNQYCPCSHRLIQRMPPCYRVIQRLKCIKDP